MYNTNTTEEPCAFITSEHNSHKRKKNFIQTLGLKHIKVYYDFQNTFGVNNNISKIYNKNNFGHIVLY